MAWQYVWCKRDQFAPGSLSEIKVHTFSESNYQTLILKFTVKIKYFDLTSDQVGMLEVTCMNSLCNFQ